MRVTLATLLALGLCVSAPAALAAPISFPGLNPASSPRNSGPGRSLPVVDSTFMDRAAQSNMEEIGLGMVAEQKAQHPAVREYAQMMVKDHMRATEQQLRLAQQLNVTVPPLPSAEQLAAAERIADLEGAAFDRAYIERMVKSHEATLELFREEVRNGLDPDVRHFAASKLPALHMHYEHAKKLMQQLQARR